MVPLLALAKEPAFGSKLFEPINMVLCNMSDRDAEGGQLLSGSKSQN